ncbi:MAG: tetratricopeptide repeat protein [Candidatus Tenebribacter burtonii]|jgi:tetratricopeptide (TPR) repeat protein|nr:tetratricopeptide repeat protein [Candidatus Tenebribacter burtonii]
MKKSILLLLFLLILSSVYTVTQTETIFNEAITSYQEKDYHTALEKFDLIENEGIINADLYYNIGNCYFRINEIGRAILYFKKALKVRSDHQAARRNLEYALTFTKDKQNSENESVIRSFWLKTFDSFSINFLAIIILAIFLIIIILISIMIIHYRNRERTVPLFLTTIFIFLFLAFFIISILKWQEFHNDNEAVILSTSVIGYSGPGEDFTRVFTIHEGMIFTLERDEDNWSLIKLENGLGGWIKKDTYIRIEL